ncbi:acrylyl-CoA reductase family protein [Lapidilactobacillus luobeiensis]|uniref:acrylyl-CoA reductase family protein n=1 Tax=Lapidilactobacillus luobeiensis TaxID=2950371 RepID=UPI0021C38642|nr:acryloyl-CoA reductase [Lapidilactobacillus luobeiensis]
MQKKALVVDLVDERPSATLTTRPVNTLGPDLVRVQVAYSDINYKDALVLKARSGVVRDFPRVPGIDFSGWVIESSDHRFQVGDAVVGTGWQIGIQIDGGYQEIVDVPGDFLHPLGGKRTVQDAALIGTAGITAAIGLTKVLDSRALAVKDAPILISGVTGGVGGWQLAILAQLGYTNITAVTRQADLAPQLQEKGAAAIIAPETLRLEPRKPLARQKFAVVFDNLGGDFLADILAQVQQDGHVVSSGNASGIKLTTTVLPFILRGITLHGVDSVNYPVDDREELWQLFENNFWPEPARRPDFTEVQLAELIPLLTAYPHSAHHERTLVKLRSRRPRGLEQK